MYNDEEGIWLGRLKSKRRKKRLQKLDKEKQLRRMDDELHLLYEQDRNMGYIELEKPLPAGWERHFVLRPDIAQGSEGPFFQTILDKINTRQLCNRKDFLKKDKKTKKLNPKEQHTKYLSAEDFAKCRFSEKAKLQFEYKWLGRGKHKYRAYVYLNEWQFEFKVRRHYITHVAVHNNVLQQRINELESVVYRIDTRGKLNNLYGNRGWKTGDKYKDIEKDLDRSLKDYLLNRHSEMS